MASENLTDVETIRKSGLDPFENLILRISGELNEFDKGMQ